jgi:4-diphosphocytidyl-2-C-methyl-D-erythritol kinase
MTELEEPAPAKVNLDLCITGRRADGYHELDSVVVFGAAADRLTFRPGPALRLEVAGRFAGALDAEADNLVLRAARRLAGLAGVAPDVAITLEKNLPVAAGLGGGSADAAATLRGLDRFWRLGLSAAELMPVAQGLGADVPVCLLSRPARMRGIGERLERLEGLPEWYVLLVHPAVPCPTGPVFAELGAIPPQIWPQRPAGDWLGWLRSRPNHLEAPACRLVPRIHDTLSAIARQKGCRLARMSGSGAACFGLFEDSGAAAMAEAAIGIEHPSWWLALGPIEPR